MSRGPHLFQRPLAWAAVAVVVLAGLALAAAVRAQSGGPYDLRWNTVDGGGETFSSGGNYTLGGTIGQPEAGPALTNGAYALVGGFWGGAGVEYRIYLPLVLSRYR